MKALRRFTVRPQLPPPLQPLGPLIRNLRWSWHPASQDLFADIDRAEWSRSAGDPLRLLGAVSVDRLEELAGDERFLARMHDLAADLDHYLTDPRWYQHQVAAGASYPAAIAYFSMEFGVTEALPNYSGGLGILAGDHLKSASDLGVPIVGVGLLYRYGYFWQSLSADGWQQEHYPAHDPQGLLIERVLGPDGEQLAVTVPMPGDRLLTARIWVAQVGRVPLLLLDADHEDNEDGLRAVTDRLYGGDQDHRIKQEILLGIGGVRAVNAFTATTGHPRPEVFHMNEGHAGFLGLERMRDLIAEHGLTFAEALSAVRAGTVFTTHTPVPAGIDRFPIDLVRHYLDGDGSGDGDASRLLPGLGVTQVLALGAEDDPGRFNMAHMGLRLAQRANGVAKLHGVVSRAMFAGLYPGFEPEEVPIGSVTNGVHLPTWAAREMYDVAGDMADWQDLASAEVWPSAAKVSRERLWELRNTLRGRLVMLARAVARRSAVQRGATMPELEWTESILDPDILTIGFARRVSTYKRLTLMLRDPERLRSILLDPRRPVQIVVAGKAHPADDGGKRYMQEMVRFTDDRSIRHRIVFLPDYDMGMAAILCAGADVWLNNPIRPQEASGTSGMKAALNGALNLSICDGWWDELFDGHDGWAIPTADGVGDERRRDDLEAAALYDLIEKRVAPLFYRRNEAGLPEGWVDTVRHTLAYLGPRVQATRMVRDYVTGYYAPAAAASRAVNEDLTVAKGLAAWTDRVRTAWPGVRVLSVDTSGIGTEPSLGNVMTVRAHCALGGLEASDVTVQAVIGRVDATEHLHEIDVVDMVSVGSQSVDGEADPVQRYEAALTLARSGPVGYTVRILPRHELLASPAELGLVTIA